MVLALAFCLLLALNPMAARGQANHTINLGNFEENIRLTAPERPMLLGAGVAVTGVTRINGRERDDQFGRSLATGDINGDGIADMVLGAIAAGAARDGGPEGEVYVLWGSRSIPDVAVARIDSLDIVTIHGTQDGNIGEYLGCLDFNNDGHAEILLGDVVFNKAAGRTFVIYGERTLPEDIDLDVVSASDLQIVQILGEQPLGYLGRCFASGDINGDGYKELLIGSWERVGQGEFGPGRGYVIWGTQELLPPLVDLGNYKDKITFLGDEMYDSFGFRLSCADYNGDGLADAAFSAPAARVDGKWTGKVFVIYGSSDLAQHLGSTLPSSRVERTQILGYKENQFLGMDLASGDINSDNIDDLIIGASDTETRAGSMAGEVYAIFGKRAGETTDIKKDEILQNYPNPFNAFTIISYPLSHTQNIKLTIYNMVGVKVRTLVDGRIQAGENSAIWNGLDDQFKPVSSGVYFCTFKTDSHIETVKILLLK